MRKFAFVVFNTDNSVKERFAIDYITNPSGLGWKLKLSTLSGDVVDTITKVVQEKQTLKLTINFWEKGYERCNIFSQWLQKYSKESERIALEYDDGVQVRYVEGKVTELLKSEKNEYYNLSCDIKFTPLTPFFVNIEQQIVIRKSSTGKCYPFKYPYQYGKNEIENNEINNPYISPVPVTVKITGSITHPIVSLIDENGNTYSHVGFPNTTLQNGQTIVINSASRKIYYIDQSGVSIDYSMQTDASGDTFLFAESGLTKIGINLDELDTGELTGSWRQYGL